MTWCLVAQVCVTIVMSFPLFMSFPRKRESRDMCSYPAWIPASAGMTTGGYLHPLCFGKVIHETWGEHARHDAYSYHQAPVCRGQGRPRLRGFLAFIVLPSLEGGAAFLELRHCVILVSRSPERSEGAAKNLRWGQICEATSVNELTQIWR